MTNQKWPELYIYTYGVEDEGIKDSFMWIVYPHGSIDFLDQDGTSKDSCYVNKSSLLFNEDVELVCEIKPYPAEKRWKPKLDEKYYSFMSWGKIIAFKWQNTNADKGKLRLGNCFRTKKEAKEKLEQVKAVLRSE